MINELSKTDIKIQQLKSHISELQKILNNNSVDIVEKEKTNKYLTNVKNKFKEYEESLSNLKRDQLNYFNTLKLYLQSLNEENYENVKLDLEEIEREIETLR